MAATPLIVSLWSNRERQGFLCSGLLLTGRHILTVRHAFEKLEDGAPVWVRLIDGVDGDVEARLLQRHRERDAALLELVTAVRLDASPQILTRSDRSLDAQACTLFVIDPVSMGRAAPTNYSVAAFDHATGEYVVAPENAKGHSGGVVDVGGQVVGLLSRRKESDPLCRAVAMHLLWPWIEESIGTPGSAPGTAPAPGSAPSPAYADLLAKVRAEVRHLLADTSPGQAIARHWGTDPLAGFDPGDPAEQLRARLNALHRATQASIPGWRPATPTQIGETRRTCRALVSTLVKLAVDPGAGAAALGAVAAAPPERLHLACQFGGTGDLVYCALGDVPYLLGKRGDGVAGDNAVHLEERLPSGQGADLRQEVLRKLWDLVMPEGPPGRIEGKDYKRLLARVERHRDRDGRRYLLAAPGPANWCLASDYRTWADELRLGLVLHEEGDCPYLLLDEPDLIDTVREYLELLETL